MPAWTVIIPVKSADSGKSRLGRGPDVARAIALDTIAAAAAATVRGSSVRVVVVTADDEVAREARLLGADVVGEPASVGLAAAIEQGLADVAIAEPRAVLLGDLPALRPDELAGALESAAGVDHAFVPDAEGTGSTLVTARAGVAFEHRFGADSARLHREAGLVPLDLPADSTLRRDVDLAEHLDGAGMGPRTLAVLGR